MGGEPARADTSRNLNSALASSMKHILVTNDFPPKIGGIQSLLWEWWRRLPPESFAVLSRPYARSRFQDVCRAASRRCRTFCAVRVT